MKKFLVGDVVEWKQGTSRPIELVIRSQEFTHGTTEKMLCVSECGTRIVWASDKDLVLIRRPVPASFGPETIQAIAKAVAVELRLNWADRMVEPVKNVPLAEGLVGVWVPSKKPEKPWTPKIGDWVKVTKPLDCAPVHKIWWVKEMDEFDGKVMQVTSINPQSPWAILNENPYEFDFAWLSPAERPKDFIEQFMDAIQSPTQQAEPPKHRTPTLADLANGPIECEYRGDDEQWRSGLLVYILKGVMPFLCTDKEELLCGQWEQCRIEDK